MTYANRSSIVCTCNNDSLRIITRGRWWGKME